MAIRVGIVDDHPATALGTAAILNAQPDIRTVASAATARELVERRQSLDVVLLDLSLGDGTSPTGNIRTLAATRAQILAYTAGDRPPLIREAARAGVIGMIRKSERGDAIVQAVRRAARGIVVAQTEWAAALDSDPDLTRAGLTDREGQVLMLYASGETADRVAESLGISVETVTDHVRRIRGKYAAVGRPASTKIDLFRRAQEDGYLPGT
ncbi:MAG: response regulator transcription factor [Microbacterium sp.]